MAGLDDSYSAEFRDPRPVPLKSGKQYHYLLHDEGGDAKCGTKLGIWCGDIIDAKKFDVWVNPENTDMEMAHFHTASVSGIIRFLGASFSRRFGDSDDKIYRALLDEISNKWGVRRPVPAGSAYLTESGQLKRTHNVKAIAHVACVEPRDSSRPGSGIVPVKDLSACVKSVLSQIEAANKKKRQLRTVLFPIMATGMGGGGVRAHSEIIVNAAAEYIRHNPASTIEEVYFLAFKAGDDEHLAAAIENIDGVRKL